MTHAASDGRPPTEYVHVADAIVRNGQGQLLIVELADGRFWIPGGRVEPGETFAETAVREVGEETGIVVRFEGIACVTEGRMRSSHVVFVTCVTRMLGGELTIPAEDVKIADVRWVGDAAARELLPDYPAKPVIIRRNPPHVPHFRDTGPTT